MVLVGYGENLSFAQDYAMKDGDKSKEQLLAELKDLRARERKLKESEELYKNIVELTPDGFLTVDLKGNVIDCNEAFLSMTGYTKDEVLGIHFTKIPTVRKQDLPKYIKIFNSLLQGKSPISLRFRWINKKEEMRVAEARISLIKKGNKPVAVHFLAKDVTDRQHNEEALHQQQELLTNIVESMGEGILVLDPDYHFNYWNREMENISKVSREELVGSMKTAWDVFPHLKEEGVDKMMKSAMKGKVVRRNDIPFRLQDGTSGFTSEVFLPLKTPKGKIRGIVGVIRETTERKLAEDRLKTSLKEKEVLLREIHHRVKNNMQIMSSLLRLQIASIPDEETKAMCMESQTRIRSMALIHEKLYKSQDFSSINFAEYIKDLAAHLFHSYNIRPGVIKLTMDIEDVFMDINTAIPCGLLFNELFSNSLKHAFPAAGKGQIDIGLNRGKQGKCNLIIKDDGIGFPESYDFENPATLGLQLVSDLVKQIDGSIQLDRKAGTTFRVTFTLGQK